MVSGNNKSGSACKVEPNRPGSAASDSADSAHIVYTTSVPSTPWLRLGAELVLCPAGTPSRFRLRSMSI